MGVAFNDLPESKAVHTERSLAMEECSRDGTSTAVLDSYSDIRL
jgi:hypothetical protein